MKFTVAGNEFVKFELTVSVIVVGAARLEGGTYGIV
jgi:hypothetical protein